MMKLNKHILLLEFITRGLNQSWLIKNRYRCAMFSWKREVERCQRAFTWWSRNGRIRRRGHDCGLAAIEYRLRRFSKWPTVGNSGSNRPESRRILFEPRDNRTSRFPSPPCSTMINPFFHPYLWWNDTFELFRKNSTHNLSARFDYISHFEVRKRSE